MGALSRKLRSVEGDRVSYYCPGCKAQHTITFNRDGIPHPSGRGWTWNMDTENPVFSPSVLVTIGTRSPESLQACQEFLARHGRPPTLQEIPHDRTYVCHSFIGCNGAKPGEIIYLSDSTHEYAGKTVPLPDFNRDWE
jgi:hypothetical protein